MKYLRHHAASVLILPSGRERDDVLLAIYDNGYPVKAFRNHYNFIGGNTQKDASPLDTLKRELQEEFNSTSTDSTETAGSIFGLKSPQAYVRNDSYLAGRRYVDLELMQELRNAVIKNIVTYNDFLVGLKKEYMDTEKDLKEITSVFLSEIDNELFNRIGLELKDGKQITNEGFARIVTSEELKSGNPRGAWGYSTMIGNILGIKVPEYDFIDVTSLNQKPKQSYKEYKSEFEYERNPEA